MCNSKKGCFPLIKFHVKHSFKAALKDKITEWKILDHLTQYPPRAIISCLNISSKGDSNTFWSIVLNPCKEASKERNIKTKHTYLCPVGNRYSGSICVLCVHYCIPWTPFPPRTICSKKCTYVRCLTEEKCVTPQAFPWSQ